MARSFRIAWVFVPIALLVATAAAQAAHQPKKAPAPRPAAAKCDATYAGSRIRLPEGKCGATGYPWRSISGEDLNVSGAQPTDVIRAFPRG